MALRSRATPSIQIKNVPEDVHRILRARAAARGQSLQEYLLARLTEDAREEPLNSWLDRVGTRSGGSVSAQVSGGAFRDVRAAGDGEFFC